MSNDNILQAYEFEESTKFLCSSILSFLNKELARKFFFRPEEKNKLNLVGN